MTRVEELSRSQATKTILEMKLFIAIFALCFMAATTNASYIKSYYPSPAVVNVVHDYAPVHHVHHVEPVVVAPRAVSYGWDHSYYRPAPVVKVVKVHHSYQPSYAYDGWFKKK